MQPAESAAPRCVTNPFYPLRSLRIINASMGFPATRWQAADLRKRQTDLRSRLTSEELAQATVMVKERARTPCSAGTSTFQVCEDNKLYIWWSGLHIREKTMYVGVLQPIGLEITLVPKYVIVAEPVSFFTVPIALTLADGLGIITTCTTNSV